MDWETNVSDDPPELKVTFHPNLYLQRRGWVLDQLRREAVTRVLDVGCGEGELLACLCQPAPWLPPPPSELLPNGHGMSIYADPSTSDRPYYPVPNSLPDKIANLHPTHIAGLDVSEIDLEYAIAGTAPKPPAHWNENVRWEELEVKIWKGGLESVNEEFVGVECIVAMEVIEHLTEDVLPAFAPILLGVYHPRLLLVTTPNFTFNARFHPPDTPGSRVGGYPDPTGRTDRVFRHHDHKFEWTVSEFKEWCESVAGEWGYAVEVDGVGKAAEPDEWGRDEELGYATQVAKFMRVEDQESQDRRARKAEEVLEGGSKARMHELLKTHHYLPHPKARRPVPLNEIGDAVAAKMQSFGQTVIRLEELWWEQEISVMCGGWFEYLVAAVEQHKGLEIRKEEGAERSEWHVVLLGGVQTEAKPESWWNEPEEDLFEDPEYETEESAVEEARTERFSNSHAGWSVQDTNKESEADTWQSGWGSGWDSGWSTDSGQEWGTDTPA